MIRRKAEMSQTLQRPSRDVRAGLVVAAFSLVGLLGAYWIQAKFAKGKAVPALPPIAVMSLIGLALVSFVF